MKAVFRFAQEMGGIELRDMPVPEIGDGDVLVKVRAAGLCGSDMNSFLGRSALYTPVIMGHEFSGEIAEVGNRVTAWKVGDRVCSDNTGYVCGTCSACIRGEFLQCPSRKGLGSRLNGGFAEYVKVQEHVLMTHPTCLMRLPDGISFDEGAIIDPPANGYNAAIQQGGLMPGESVAVFGAGPLSLGSITVANAAGAVPIICVVRASTNALHREAAKKLGATIILEAEDPDIVRKIKDLTGGEGVSMVLDGAGPNELIDLAVNVTRYGGKILRIGYDWSPVGCSLNNMVNRNISLIGHMGFNPVSWRNVISLLGAGKIDVKTMITHVMPLTDFFKGVEAMRSREAIKVVYHPFDD